jgi:hypothetical protein
MKSVLTAFRLILQTIAVWIYPAFLAAGLLECITMGDHAEVDVPSPIFAGQVLVMATDGFTLASGKVLF